MLGIPKRVWIASLGAFGIGVVILLSTYLIKHWFIPVVERESIPWQEIARDVGIAFLVAGIVSLIYEWSTRTAEDRERITDILNKIMSAHVTREIWNEVNTEILHRKVIRRKFCVKLRIEPNDALPANQRVLYMEAEYELYSLKAGSLKVGVTHYLDQHMEVKELMLPRFESVQVIRERLETITRKSYLERTYKDQSLNKIYDKQQGCIKLEKEDEIDLPPYTENLPVRIIITRYEIISVPGLYTLVMPEMVIPEESDGLTNNPTSKESNDPTIKVTIESPFPKDIEANIYTWFPTHDFKPLKTEANVWTFRGVMLAGQGFSIVFKAPKTEATSAKPIICGQ